MDVGLVGEGPAREAVETALGDLGVSARTVSPGDINEAEFAVVSDNADASAFERANGAALAGETPWLAVVIGGFDGEDNSGAAVAGFSPERTGCYECLRTRVRTGHHGGEASASERERDHDDTPDWTEEVGWARFAGALAGRETVSLLAGGKSTLLGGVVTMPGDRKSRPVLPVPGCVCQTPPPVFQLNYLQPPPREELLDRLGRAVDGSVGPIRRVEEHESVPVTRCVATLADTSEFSDARPPRRVWAAGTDRDRATLATLQAALARYSGAVYRTEDLIIGGHADIELAVSPEAFVAASSAPSSVRDEPRRWVLGRKLDDGRPGHLPADRVYPLSSDGSALPGGLAAGASTAEAMLDGLYGVIAHDAAMLSWYSTDDPPALAVTDGRFQQLARRASAEGLAVTPVLVTQDIPVPSVAVAVHPEGEPSRAAVDVAANLDPVAAARAALVGALGRWLAGETASTDAADLRALVEPSEEVAAADAGPDTPPSGFAEYLTTLDRVQEAGLTPYGVRLTTTDLADIGCEVGRVVVPGAQPLVASPAFGERAERVPAAQGHEPRLDRSPHPYGSHSSE